MINSKNEIFSQLATSMIKAQNEFKSFLRNKFKEHHVDLTFEMLQVLTHLWEKDGVNQQELANLLHKDKASLTYLLDNLSKRGLIKRTEDAADRRNKIVTLLPDAIKMRNLLRPWVDEMYVVAGKDIPVQQLKNAILIYEKMVENFDATKEFS